MKTKANDASVEVFLDRIPNATRREDAHTLVRMLKSITRQPPKMWGPSIVGHGSYRYTTDSGRSGEMPLAAFAVRGKDLVVYLSCDDPQQPALLSRLGKHKMGKSCLYFRRLADLDRAVLEQLVDSSIKDVEQHYG